LVSPVVLFDDGETGKKQKQRHFANQNVQYTFVQCPADGDRSTDYAATWLEAYVAQHSGRVISNFDEQRPIMADVPLSYQRLVQKTFDRTIIEHLHMNGGRLADRIDHITQEQVMSVSVTLGDGTVIHGDFVVANSIRESFNRVKDSNMGAELKKLLERLTSEVGTLLQHLDGERAKQAASDLDVLTKEAISPKPRSEWWQLSVEGLKDAATAVRDIGKPVIETVKLIVPLLAAASV
jgi:hypothetical protein